MNVLLKQTEDLLSRMSRAEKARVLQWVVADLGDAFPGIESHPGVCGGEPCMVRTRIPVWVLVKAREHGLSDAQILSAYPTLNAEDLAEAWSFDRAHRDAILRQIADNETD